MRKSPMVEVKINRKKNLCYLKVTGYNSEKELIDGKIRFFKAIENLRPNMDMILDIRSFAPLNPENMKHMIEVQRKAAEKGIRRAVRIVNNIPGKKQVENIKKESGFEYETIEAKNFEEALSLLN